MARPCRLLPPIARGLAAAFGAVLSLGLAVALGWWRYRSVAGEPSWLLEDRGFAGHLVLDREGRELGLVPGKGGRRGREMPLEALGPRVVAATLASEDRDFHGHHGVEPRAVLRAVVQNLTHGRLVSGASTITQQLVKMLDHEGRGRPRTLGEKLREAARAQNLEEAVGKRAVLEAYLNRLDYGGGLTGAEAAARGLFGKPAAELSWAEAAALAVLPRAPTYLDPARHPERVVSRRDRLLEALRDAGALSRAELSEALATPLALASRGDQAGLAPHLVAELRAHRDLPAGRASRTTLDADLQRDVEALVATHLPALAEGGALDAALLVADNHTGEILALVGSADHGDPAILGEIDMTRAPRQVASTVKPFLYGLGFERGLSPEALLADVPTTFADGWSPKNLDGAFAGPVSARAALASSLNVPAARLAAELPRGALLERLRAAGLDSLDRDPGLYGHGLALGAGEATLREIATAYVTLARGGERIELHVTPAFGRPLGSPALPGPRVFSAESAALVTDVLADEGARGGRFPASFDFPAALKTGTSSGHRDVWTAGFTRERTVVVWAGNADGSPTRGLTGGAGAGPLFAGVLRRAMRDVAAPAPLVDEGLLEVAEVCPLSGLRPGPACPHARARRFLRGHAPTEICELHRHARPRDLPPRGARASIEVPFRCDPAGGATLVVLPPLFDGLAIPGAFPLSRAPGCDPGGVREELRLDAPGDGVVLALDLDPDTGEAEVTLGASALGADGPSRVASVDFYVDGAFVARSAAPFRVRARVGPGDHELVVQPADPRAASAALGHFRVHGSIEPPSAAPPEAHASVVATHPLAD